MKYEVKGDVIINHRGDVMAHKVYGVWETKNEEVLGFIDSLNKPVEVKVKKVHPVVGPVTTKKFKLKDKK
jgi:hypothetical protein|tara:strand:+ start:3597 stop:3806 length:210 start_codon:yes stop_codon:yes gene_type:complete